MKRMHDPTRYGLVDFGEGRKLERWGPRLVDRPSPQAKGRRRNPEMWDKADLRYLGTGCTARWEETTGQSRDWTVTLSPLNLHVRLTSSGQLGAFPEQQRNWRWLTEHLRKTRQLDSQSSATLLRSRVLNLFGYTGGSTIAAAMSGAEVTHVDSAANLLPWARRNCELNHVDPLQVRWITEDARKFVQREIRRGSRYDGIILDPPAYGHGSGRSTWKLERDLPGLIQDCCELLSNAPKFLVLTCHSRGFGLGRVRLLLKACRPVWYELDWEFEQMTLETPDGRALSSGVMARGCHAT
jgi:23S rRNA (cytosine1962-C5)-methyltransferase